MKSIVKWLSNLLKMQVGFPEPAVKRILKYLCSSFKNSIDTFCKIIEWEEIEIQEITNTYYKRCIIHKSFKNLKKMNLHRNLDITKFSKPEGGYWLVVYSVENEKTKVEIGFTKNTAFITKCEKENKWIVKLTMMELAECGMNLFKKRVLKMVQETTQSCSTLTSSRSLQSAGIADIHTAKRLKK